MTAYMETQAYTIEEYAGGVTGYVPEGQTLGHFVQIFVPRYFNCLVFNADGAMSVDVTKTELMGVLITAGEDENVTSMFAGNMRGFYMFLHNASDLLYEIARPVTILSPGIMTKVTVDRHFYHQYEHPYSECGVLEDKSLVINLADRTNFDQVIATNSSYTRQTCLAFCTQMLTARRCGCQSNRLSFNVTSVAYCSMRDELGCAATVWSSPHDIDEACADKCPLECVRTRFVLVQSRKISRNNDYSLFFPYLSAPTVQKNFVEVTIQYNDLAYVETREEPKMNGKELFAFVGGHLHLFLGMSLMSFVQIVELIASLVIKVSDESSPTRSENTTSAMIVNQLTLVKMDSLPDAVRASHKCMSFVWLVLFVSASGSCIYLICDTLLMFDEHRVTTTVTHPNDVTSAIRFCSALPIQTALARHLLAINHEGTYPNYQQFWQIREMISQGRISIASLTNLTNAELARILTLRASDMVVDCSINGRACRFDFHYDPTYIGCYRVLPENEIGKHKCDSPILGIIDQITHLRRLDL